MWQVTKILSNEKEDRSKLRQVKTTTFEKL